MHLLYRSFATLLSLFLWGGEARAEEPPLYPPAPDFPQGLEWLNVARPLSLADLRGKVVILHFWTYGCINCIHVMQELDRLQRKYGHRYTTVDVLYVADTGNHAIRRVELGSDRVTTIAGTGLHDFGDRDGPLQEAQLQHPQGVAPWTRALLLVADTYNHKLKLLDLKAGTIETLLGSGAADARPSLPALDEPGGLAVTGERVLVADTNHRRVVVFYPRSGTAETWEPHRATAALEAPEP